MTASPLRPRLLSHEALIAARDVYRRIIQASSIERRQSQVICLPAEVASFAAEQLPIVEGVIRAQEEAAQALDLAKRPRLVCGAFANVPAPHPDAANPQSPTSDHQPGPTVA